VHQPPPPTDPLRSSPPPPQQADSPPASHSQRDRPPASHSQWGRPLASHSQWGRPLASHSQWGRPLASHSQWGRPLACQLRRRLGGAALALASLTILAVATRLTPSGKGHGTHEQLGLAPCPWAAGLDAPCPTCGMTTAFAHAAEGRVLAGLSTQPLGFLFAILAAVLFWGGLHVALTGSGLGRVAAGCLQPRLLWLLGLLALLAWGFKFLTWNHP